MSIRRSLSLAGAACALVMMLSSSALAAGTTVSVRVEGAKHTLLAAKSVRTHSGAIKRYGGSCPATRAIGALNIATKHRWGGSFSPSLGYEITSILGERHRFSSPSFWEFFINNKPANFGVCGQRLRKGDRLLFAPAPDSGTVFLSGLRGPRKAITNHSFRIRAVAYDNSGAASSLAGAKLTGAHQSVTTNSGGFVTVEVNNSGRYRFTVSKRGYIRSELTVRVS
jgi:hypothetical protein